MKKISLNLPNDNNRLTELKAGDTVSISGTIFTARDAAHKKLCNLLAEGNRLPLEISGSAVYYCGPCPEKPGEVIGSAGPTTSGRMDPYTPSLLEKGLRVMIGKGERSAEVIESIKKNKAVYFGATGGTGALIADCIKSSEIVAFEELGCEAIRKLYVENMEVVVLTDTYGNDFYSNLHK